MQCPLFFIVPAAVRLVKDLRKPVAIGLSLIAVPAAGRLVKDPRKPVAKFSPLRRLAAMLSVFFVSGVMHELLFW